MPRARKACDTAVRGRRETGSLPPVISRLPICSPVEAIQVRGGGPRRERSKSLRSQVPALCRRAGRGGGPQLPPDRSATLAEWLYDASTASRAPPMAPGRDGALCAQSKVATTWTRPSRRWTTTSLGRFPPAMSVAYATASSSSPNLLTSSRPRRNHQEPSCCSKIRRKNGTRPVSTSSARGAQGQRSQVCSRPTMYGRDLQPSQPEH